MKESYRVIVKVYRYKDNEYAIIRGEHDGIIRAINYKYLDTDGKLIKPLNGIEMFCDHNANTVSAIIERINRKHDWDEYISENGIDTSDDEALLKAIAAFYKL